MGVSFEDYLSYKKEMDYYRHILAVMNWDYRVNAPKASFSEKLDTIKYFNGKLFSLETAPEFGDLLFELFEKSSSLDKKSSSLDEKSSSLDKKSSYLDKKSSSLDKKSSSLDEKSSSLDEKGSSLDEAKALTIEREVKEFQKKSRVPADFMEEYTVMRGQCEKKWEEAKTSNDYSVFAPWLQKNIDLSKKYYSFLEPNEDPYDTMLKNWEGGLDSLQIKTLFNQLKTGIRPKVLEAIQARETTYSMEGITASKETMEKVQHFLLQYIGFDFAKGGVGVTPHALTSRIDGSDIRITNKLTGRNPIDICFSAIHEGGHGIYYQNVNPCYDGLALSDLIYMDVHESQSRFYENMLGRNIAFWKPIYADLCHIWPELKAYSLEELDQYMNRLQASEIRTSADEITYCMHILLRFEMEMAMFQGGVSVYELKDMWNEMMKEMLGIVPQDDAHGILQDMHWSSIYVGYFPTYLLGSIYDGLFLEQMENDLGSVTNLLEKGEMNRIGKWLNQNIHVHGSMFDGPTLIRKVCNCQVSVDPLLHYFLQK